LRIEHLIQAFSTRSGIPETVATTANHQLWNVGLVGYNLHTLNGQTLRFISREEMNSGKSSRTGSDFPLVYEGDSSFNLRTI
jgi:hypothetical protein